MVRVAFLSVRSRAVARAVRSEPALLVREGGLCRSEMREARVTEAELRTVLREARGRAACRRSRR